MSGLRSRPGGRINLSFRPGEGEREKKDRIGRGKEEEYDFKKGSRHKSHLRANRGDVYECKERATEEWQRRGFIVHCVHFLLDAVITSLNSLTTPLYRLENEIPFSESVRVCGGGIRLKVERCTKKSDDSTGFNWISLYIYG